MKKVIGFALIAFLTVSCWCGAGEAAKPSGKKLKVGTMAMSVGIPVRYAEVAGFFKDAGLNVEVVVLATGAPINEAMAAGELDVAASGMASVFGLSTGRYKYVGDGMMAMEGEIVFARPDSIYAKTKGPKEGLLGDAKTVKGANILGPLATAAHLSAIKYVESLGLKVGDFNMVSMDFSQAQQAFKSGQGDLVALATPWSNQLLEEGYVVVSDLGKTQGIHLTDAVFVQTDLLKTRRADILAFLDCYYRAADALNKDHELWKKVGKEWYAQEGKKVSDQQMSYETRQKKYNTLDSVLTPDRKFGGFMITIGEFFKSMGMIKEENYPNIAKSLDSSLVQELKAKYGKK